MKRNRPFFEKKQSSLERLIGLSEQEQLRDDEFFSLAKKARKDIVRWWKKKYNYSSNDPRYLEATKSLIMQDFLDSIIDDYNENIGNDPVGERILRGRALDPEWDKKELEAHG